MVSSVGKIIGYVQDIFSMLFSILFQIPTKRFDEMNGVGEIEYNSLKGHVASAIDRITKNSGRVRYSGANWQARISGTEPIESIEKGTTVKIESVKGNIVLVARNDISHAKKNH